MHRTTQALLAVSLLAAACDSAGRPVTPASQNGNDTGPVVVGAPAVPGAATAPAPVPYAISQGNAVLWKRHAAFEADLMRALELSSDALCKELGERNCIRDVHVIALGGNDPFRSGINQPPSQTLSTTPIVVDRVLLSACSARAAADKVGPAKVFSGLDLRGPAPAPEAPAVEATIVTLFRRLLARDPKASERALIKTLLSGEDAPQSGEEFATLACFAIGSSLEFLFQ